MDDYLSLRSLEGIGRPSGTGRPSSSSTGTRNERSREREIARKPGDEEEGRPDGLTRREKNDFSHELDEARTRQAEPTIDSSAAEEFAANTHDTLQPEIEAALRASEALDEPSNSQLESASSSESLQLGEISLQPGSGSPSTLADVATVPIPSVTLPNQPTQSVSATPALASQGATPAATTSIVANSGIESGTANTLQSELTASVSTIEVAAASDTGSSLLDASAGGLTSADAELPQSTSNALVTEGARFEQTLANANAKLQSSPVQDLETVESVLKQFKVAIDPKMDRAVIQLHPAELGRIAVRIEMDRGKLRAVMRADRAETLELLERHAPELRAALESSGVEAESFDFGLGLDQQDEQAQSERGAQDTTNELNPVLEQLEDHAALARRIVSDTAVDTYA